jgi:hypothetical protein
MTPWFWSPFPGPMTWTSFTERLRLEAKSRSKQNGSVAVAIYKNMKKQLNLGEFISLLSAFDQEWRIQFDFGGVVPISLNSYRGYYHHLAIGFKPDMIGPTISELLSVCKRAIGAKMEGWKGGDYEMGELTPLWVANPGSCHGTAVVGIMHCRHYAVIETTHIP